MKNNIKQANRNSDFNIKETISGIQYGVIEDNIYKLGFCVDKDDIAITGGINIYLKQLGKDYFPVLVNSSGMYEVSNEEDMELNITGIKVPLNIDFTLDYLIKE